jgi:hypothetical protein
MPQSEARAWWADVQDVRETIERRRAAEQAVERPRAHAARSHRPDPAPMRRSADGHGSGRARRRPEGARRPLHLPAGPPPAAGRRTVDITGRPALAAQTAGPAAGAGARASGAAAGEAGLGARGAGPAARGAGPAAGVARRRRPSPTPAERLAHRPDRIAAWAAVLGFAMMVVAAL